MKKYLIPLLALAALFTIDTARADGYVGRVLSVSDTSITVSSEGSKKTTTIDDGTQVLALGGKPGSLSDVKVGYLVKVLPGASDGAAAIKIKVFKAGKE